MRTGTASAAASRPSPAIAVRGRGRLESIALGAVWSYPLSKSWTLTAAAEARRLFGDAKDSPIVKERNQYSVGTMVTYTY